MSSETSPSIFMRWIHHRGYPIEFNDTGSEETLQRILKDEQRFRKTTREKSNETSAKSAESHTATMSTETPTSILLNELRQHPIELNHEGSEETMKRILEHKSKFPKTIREAITEASKSPDSNPRTFYAHVYKVLKLMVYCCRPENMNLNHRQGPSVLSKGLNCDVDTEEELEVAIRFFPDVLYERDEVHLEEPARQWHDPKYWATLSSNTIPFAPLIIDLYLELGQFKVWPSWYMVWSEILQGEELRIVEPEGRCHKDPDFDRQAQETYFSVLVRLKERDVISNKQVSDTVCHLMNYSMSPRYIVKKLQFVLDYKPEILKCCSERRTLLGDCFDSYLWCRIRNCFFVDVDDVLIRFHTVFELGMLHYPKEMGFLFYRFKYSDYHELDELGEFNETIIHVGQTFAKETEESGRYTTPFCEALGFVGEDKIIRMVDKVLAKHGLGQPVVLLAWISEAAANKQMEVDGLYFLLRRRYAIYCQQ